VVLVGVRLNKLHVDLTPVWHLKVDLVGLIALGVQEHDRQKRSTYGLVTDLLLQSR